MSSPQGKYGVITCTKKILFNDEPVFLLRATDPLAAQAILDYADRCEAKGCDPQHVKECRDHANRVLQWQGENPTHVKKLPD